MDAGTIFGIVGFVFFLGCCLVNWDNRRKEENILKSAREAGDAYKDALLVREEAYRVLAITARIKHNHAAGFEAGREACISKLQEVSKYYATRPEALGVAGHLDEMARLLATLPSGRRDERGEGDVDVEVPG